MPEPEHYTSLLRHINSLVEQGTATGGIAMRLDGSAFYVETLAEATMQVNVVASWDMAEFAATPRRHWRAMLVGRYTMRYRELYLWAEEQVARRHSAGRSAIIGNGARAVMASPDE